MFELSSSEGRYLLRVGREKRADMVGMIDHYGPGFGSEPSHLKDVPESTPSPKHEGDLSLTELKVLEESGLRDLRRLRQSSLTRLLNWGGG